MKDAFYPYTLDVQASARKPGMFEWSIRRSGKLLERSDRFQPSEEKARDNGAKAIERLLAGVTSSR